MLALAHFFFEQSLKLYDLRFMSFFLLSHGVLHHV